MNTLPALSDEPTQYPDCCPAMSEQLVRTLANLLPHKPDTSISIGCGTGFLEAVLLDHHPNLCLIAIEVRSGIVRYLPEEMFEIVKGTWALYQPAFSAAAWMFIYPREVSLVRKYRDRSRDSYVRLVLWMGPRADLPEYEGIFDKPWLKRVHENCGLRSYEAMVTWHRDAR